MIDLQNLVATSLGYDRGTLTVFNHGHIVDTLAITGDLVSADFSLRSDSHGGTDIYGQNPSSGGDAPHSAQESSLPIHWTHILPWAPDHHG